MASRFDNRKIGVNKTEQYKNLIKDRGLKFIKQYFSPNLKHLSDDEIAQLDLIGHTWSVGDRFYKLAYKYYGDPKLWWIIAHFNKRPTESHVNIGDVLNIPLPVERVMQLLEV